MRVSCKDRATSSSSASATVIAAAVFVCVQVAFKTNPSNFRDLSIEDCLDLVKDVMTSAGERDIYTGDSVDIIIISKDGMKEEKFQLKKD